MLLSMSFADLRGAARPNRPAARRRVPAMLLAVSLLAAVAGCAQAPAPKTTVVRVPAARSAQIPVPARGDAPWGSYQGVNSCPPPAASGCTMNLNLVLEPGGRYRLTTTMLRRGKPYSFTSRARYQWDPVSRTVTLASRDENTRLRVSGDGLERIGSSALSADEIAQRPLVLRRGS